MEETCSCMIFCYVGRYKCRSVSCLAPDRRQCYFHPLNANSKYLIILLIEWYARIKYYWKVFFFNFSFRVRFLTCFHFEYWCVPTRNSPFPCTCAKVWIFLKSAKRHENIPASRRRSPRMESFFVDALLETCAWLWTFAIL